MPTPPAATVFRALGDATRLAILARLRHGEVPAGELAEGFRISRPAVSRHVHVLRRARLVYVRREGRHHFYGLEPATLRVVDEWVATYRVFWRNRLAELKHHVEARRRR